MIKNGNNDNAYNISCRRSRSSGSEGGSRIVVEVAVAAVVVVVVVVMVSVFKTIKTAHLATLDDDSNNRINNCCSRYIKLHYH